MNGLAREIESEDAMGGLERGRRRARELASEHDIERRQRLLAVAFALGPEPVLECHGSRVQPGQEIAGVQVHRPRECFR